MVDLKINGVTPTDIRLGSTQVLKVMQGAIQVYPNISTDTLILHQSIAILQSMQQIAGIFFNDDGTKLYISALWSNIFQYDLSTGWDISTAVFNQKITISEDNLNRDISFKVDGTKMYILGDSNDKIYEYNLSVAWDISTAVFNTDKILISSMYSLFFNADGTKLYIVNGSNNVSQYNLSVAWDISTVVFNQYFDTSQQYNYTYGISFNGDGTVLYVGVTTRVSKYDLSTAWDISTAVFNKEYQGLSNNYNIFVRPDEIKIYGSDVSTDEVDEYNFN